MLQPAIHKLAHIDLFTILDRYCTVYRTQSRLQAHWQHVFQGTSLSIGTYHTRDASSKNKHSGTYRSRTHCHVHVVSCQCPLPPSTYVHVLYILCWGLSICNVMFWRKCLLCTLYSGRVPGDRGNSTWNKHVGMRHFPTLLHCKK